MSEPIFPLTAAVIEAAIAEKDKRISELCAELRKVYETTSADPRLFDAYQEISKLKEILTGWTKEAEQRGNDMALLNRTILLQQQRLAEASRFIERIGTIAVERIECIEAAKKWLEGKP